ncbi:MAG: hypothetical protein ACXVNM_14620 [Bacteroidia bacterium]
MFNRFISSSNLFKIISLVIFFLNTAQSQTLSLDELISFPFIGSEKTGEVLKAKGWENSNIELISDSDLVRRTWVIDNKYNDLKSYLQFWEFNSKAEDNHISYQFSDRKTYDTYVGELKKLGYKDFFPRSKRKKKKKGDPNLYKEKDEPYINETTNSLVVVKEVFLYGMNAFMLYSYKADSKTARYLILQERDQ